MPNGTLRHFWVIRNGLSIYRRVYDGKIGEEVVGAFLSALNTFSGSVGGGALRSISLGEENYLFVRKRGLMFVATYSADSKVKKAERDLEKAASAFLEFFSEEEIKKFDKSMNLTPIAKRQDEFEEIMEEITRPVKSFWDGL
jgi:hypothetical protein